MIESAEDQVWKDTVAQDLWVLDKLILSRHLNYSCGPAGLDVPVPGWYCVRPCVNMLGLGLGAEKVWIDKETMHLPLGSFWCEWFEGRHLSVDYHRGLQRLCVEGAKPETTLSRWDSWKRTNDYIPRPPLIRPLMKRYEWVNLEFIGGRLIEVHLRRNEDFDGGIDEYIPVWTGESIIAPPGYQYRTDPDIHGRIGAFVK